MYNQNYNTYARLIDFQDIETLNNEMQQINERQI